MHDYILNIVNRLRINSGKRLVQENQLRFGRQAASDFRAPSFAAGKRIAARVSDVIDSEFFKQFFKSGLSVTSAETECFKNRENVLGGGHSTKNRRLLRQISQTEPRAQIKRESGDIALAQIYPTAL